MTSHVELSDRQAYVRLFLSEGIRRDGRSFEEFRPTVVNMKSLKHADGSAIVRLGETSVVCGIKAELAKPRAETPNEGYLIVNVTFNCSSGAPTEEAQLTTALVSRALLTGGIISLTDLCISPDNLVWVLYVDILTLNHDGGLMDAAVCSAAAALKTLTLPRVEYDVETGKKTVFDSDRRSIYVNDSLFATTYAIFEGDYILHDPTKEEEALAVGAATVVVFTTPEGENSFPLHIPASRPLTSEDVEKMRVAAKRRAGKLTELVQVASNSPER